MKIIDEKGKLFGIVNIIDLCIILFVAVVAAVVVMFFSANSNTEAQATQKRITIEVKAIEKDICDAMLKDKKIFDKVQNKALGTLVDVKIEPSVEYNLSKDTGEHIKSEVPNRFDAELVIDVSSNEELYVGKRMSVSTKDFTAAGYIIDLEKILE